MTKYKININIEFEAKDFLQAEKVQGKIEEYSNNPGGKNALTNQFEH